MIIEQPEQESPPMFRPRVHMLPTPVPAPGGDITAVQTYEWAAGEAGCRVACRFGWVDGDEAFVQSPTVPPSLRTITGDAWLALLMGAFGVQLEGLGDEVVAHFDTVGWF